MTPEEREELEELEYRHRLEMLKLHQARLMCSALRREIRLSLKSDNPFRRLSMIRTLSNALARDIGELRGN
jgi:hypothetical protein